MNRPFVLASLCAVAVLSGCATTTQPGLADAVTKAQATADEAKTMAAEARDIAQRAEQKADQALAAANKAQSTADQATSDANAAKDLAAKANEKAERMFKHSIRK